MFSSKDKGFKRDLPGLITVTIGAAIIVVFALFPVIWFTLGSFKTEVQLFSIANTFVFEPVLENYVYAFSTRNMFSYLANSTIVTIFAVIFQLAVSIPAAYSLARFKSKSFELLAYMMLATRLLPSFVILIPLYLLYLKLGLLNTRFGLIFAYTAFGIPFAVWMLRGFIRTLPREIEDSAMIDGCSTLGIIVRIVVPLIKPGIVATALLLAIGAWGEFIFALILTVSPAARTLPAAIAGFQEAYGVKWGAIMAAGVVALLPVVLLVSVAQRSLLRGITAGAFK